MNDEQKRFVFENYEKLTVRNIAKKIDINRLEVEQFISGIQSDKIKSQNKFVSRQRWIFPLIILFLALTVRVIYISQLIHSPFFEPYSSAVEDKLDDAIYDKMGLEISRGNWAGNFPYGAYRIPLYPYFLGVLYFLFGHRMLVVHGIQSLLFGSISAVLLYWISDKIFKNSRIALIAGIMAAVYIPFLFYENLLLGESLSIFLNLGGLLLFLQALSSPKNSLNKLAFSGLILGASVLLRPNTLLALFLLAAVVYYMVRMNYKNYKSASLHSLVFLACSIAPLIPFTVKNCVIYKDFIPISTIGGVNFYIGNNPQATGSFSIPKGMTGSLDEMIQHSTEIAEKEMGKSLRASEVSSYWFRKGLQSIVRYPRNFMAICVKKIGYFIANYEQPDIVDMYFTARFAPILYLGGLFGFGIIFILALYGFFVTARQKNSGLLIVVVFMLGYAASILIFFVTSRYRLPFVPFLILFAAAGLHHLISAVTNKNGKALLGFFLLLVILGVFVFSPEKQDFTAENYNRLGIAVEFKGNVKMAEESYRKAIQLSPGLSDSYNNLSLLLKSQGRVKEAKQFQSKYQQLRIKEPR